MGTNNVGLKKNKKGTRIKQMERIKWICFDHPDSCKSAFYFSFRVLPESSGSFFDP